jgi:beta-galactosidase
MPDSISRRAFLQTTAALTTATAITPALTLPANAKPADLPYPENGTLIPDEGWRLWIDDKAEWQNDDIFLPEDISWGSEEHDGKLCAKGQPLPVNPPTGGWATLTHDTGLEVTLPTSVEQHFWGKYGAGPDGKPRSYTPEEYRYAATDPPKPPSDDNIPQNGAYFGVSWFHRRIDIPAELRGKRIFLHIRGAHLRAEVYLNQKLVGYSIMEELPFECDCTDAANPGGLNVLAIRITNPFGRFDWVDGLNAKWGAVSLYRSHGFGALDRGITISAHEGDVRIKDLWALNSPEANRIVAFCKLRTDNHALNGDGSMKLEIIDPETGSIVKSKAISAANAFIGSDTPEVTIQSEIEYPQARAWELQRPALYHLRATLGGNGASTRTIAFGFRSFAVDGIDPNNPASNAVFRLNGKRTKIYTAISWGFWGLNGMFPVPELAEREVRSAQALGLNCLNFHRNLAKEDVLRWHDRLGVLRYMEPGAGKMAIGKLPARTDASANSVVMQKPTSEADKFAQRYMFVKCVEMVKAFRSHPSVIEYCLQNELGADLKNPDTLAILKAMHDEDPSRCVVLNDGFVAPPRSAAQAWYEPWDENLKEGRLHRSDETPYGDWWNNHQGAGDQWYDEFYKSPTQYTYNINLRNVLTEYGEMEGCARPDIHGLMVHQITETYKKYGGDSYDLKDHEEIIAGYNRFLDKWGFRKSFPTPDHVFRAVGRTCYESWQNYMENARINDALDFAAISGWESTAIENHSGIVDNLRNFKYDPHLIGDTLQPSRPCAKQRSLSIELGKPATFDLFLFNDSHQPVTGTLTFSMITPSDKRIELKTLTAPANQTSNQFSYLLQEASVTPPLTEEGLYRFKFALSSAPLVTQKKELWVTKPQTNDCLKPMSIAVSGISPSLRNQLEALSNTIGCFEVVDFKPNATYRAIISSGITSHTHADGQVGETTGLEAAPPMKPGHTPEPGEEAQIVALGHLQTGILDAVRAGTPLLAIPQTDTLSDGVAKELAAAGAFTYHGAVGDFRAPWMGNWYFVREHPLFDGLPQNCALGGFYQCKGRPSNGLLIDQASNGAPIEVIVGYSRDHDRNVGAGAFTTRLGKGKLLYHRCPDFHPVLQQRFLANALRWLTT